MTSGAIFLIDDNKAHRTLIKRAIAKAGLKFAIDEADSLKRARELLFEKNNVPLLAIVDLNLTDGRSTTLLAELRSSPKHRYLPIIVLSTSPLESDIEQCYANGANCYLIKADDTAIFTAEIAAAARFLIETATHQR